MNVPNSMITVVPRVNVEDPSHHKTSTGKSDYTVSWNPNIQHFNVNTETKTLNSYSFWLSSDILMAHCIAKWKLSIVISDNANQETHQVPKQNPHYLQYLSGDAAYVLWINKNVFHVYI
jgi:ABC-type molybdate transport system substrate-binding protein